MVIVVAARVSTGCTGNTYCTGCTGPHGLPTGLHRLHGLHGLHGMTQNCIRFVCVCVYYTEKTSYVMSHPAEVIEPHGWPPVLRWLVWNRKFVTSQPPPHPPLYSHSPPLPMSTPWVSVLGTHTQEPPAITLAGCCEFPNCERPRTVTHPPPAPHVS